MSKLTLSPLVKTRENKRLDLSSNPVMPQGKTIVCPYVKCSKSFSEPIELTVRAMGSLETYYACPYCFSRVSVSDKSEKDLSGVPVGTSLRESSAGIKKDDLVGCGHSLGYLKTRPKDSPIPDECLTCGRILECM